MSLFSRMRELGDLARVITQNQIFNFLINTPMPQTDQILVATKIIHYPLLRNVF